ncbi:MULTISPECIES: DnaB-like helicase C-terminal domain-containing protein [unclassified Bradyrhizobium]|uniref:DnaB-like helicase C-terminal domain-containing protein n=1 Tax=Bradyrhizobium sp. USDA 4541 TaxID=2817704 RepID=UPI0020A3CEE3|nr:DnaB-like helicase C-terminal domain-containing protein [Bradyrhizobium sp. USDA 4541]MCP1848933.1 replicative DNA helicase [Bradyrhizobium sp. USDA 4541]
MDQISTRVVDKMARPYAGQKPEGLMAMGLRDLDHVLDGGFMPGDLVVMAGRPGMGKTLVASSMSRQTARADVAGGFYSMEMPDEQAMARLLADASFGRSSLQRIPSGHILKGRLSESDVNMVRLSDLPLYIDDTSSLSVGEVSARTRSLAERAQREGRRLGFIVIDYLKYLKASSQYRGQRRYEIGEICGGLKSLAKELNIVVILLAQLNREVEKRDDKRPQLSDLRESGDIEADADTVLFLFREEYYLSKLEPKPGTPEHMEWQTKIESCHNRLEIIVAKQRSGPTDSSGYSVTPQHQAMPSTWSRRSRACRHRRRPSWRCATLWVPNRAIATNISKPVQCDMMPIKRAGGWYEARGATMERAVDLAAFRIHPGATMLWHDDVLRRWRDQAA